MAMPGREITYAELLANVEQCAAWLVREGCQPTRVVGITVADEYMHMVASLALLYLGIPQIGLPTHDPEPMRLDLAQRLAVDVVVASELQQSLPGLKTLLLTPHVPSASTRTTAPAALDHDPDAAAIYFSSSGTTGAPKIFALSQHLLAWRAERMAESERIAPGYRSLMPVSVEATPAKSKRIIALYLGATAVFRDPAAQPQPSLQALCAKLGVTNLELSVMQASSMIHDASDSRPLPATTTVYTSGARVSGKLRQSFKERFGVELFVHYGAREIGRITTTFPDGDPDDPESVGMPVPWIDLEIVDRDGGVLPANEVGEVRVRTEYMAHSYYRNPVATARHFRDGWFYPGDLASITPAGALCLHGRVDDMMNLNSIKIFPAEIERVLEEHPGVRSAAAFSKSSTAHGDIPVAAVELRTEATIGVEELLVHARERLGVRAPRRIILVATLPRNAAGKVEKQALISLLMAD